MISPPTFSFLQPWSQQHRGSSHLPELCTSGRTVMVLQGQDVGHPSRQHRRICSGVCFIQNTRWHTTTAVLRIFRFGSQKFVSKHQAELAKRMAKHEPKYAIKSHWADNLSNKISPLLLCQSYFSIYTSA